ncbi:MAG: AAC(3) family N-acetyltransferase [Chloroflexota bacterium]
MTGFDDFLQAFQRLELPRGAPVIAHASLSAFGPVQGGAEALLAALLRVFPSLVMPTFTYKTMLTPSAGPPHNAMHYGEGADRNLLAEFFRPSLPADRLMGVLPELLRRHPAAQRSSHPILSFSGVLASGIIGSQTLQDPLAPLRLLTETGGWVLLLGVDHTVNTSLHYGERQAGRRGFVRWALTPRRVVECPGFPGCSDGFNQLEAEVAPLMRRAVVGQGLIQAGPLQGLVQAACRRVQADPLALLCDRSYCERCRQVEQLATVGYKEE